MCPTKTNELKRQGAPARAADSKTEIRSFYDAISPFWRELWGIHVHHGYWRTGKESRELAQEQLTEELAIRARIKRRARVLDVGCGMGGSSLYLARVLEAQTVGITLSPVQAKIAAQAAKKSGGNCAFLVMDAESAEFDQPFDVVWSIEAVSHFNQPESFFRLCERVLKPGGVIALTDWFQADGLSAAQRRKYIAPIQHAMLVPSITTMGKYLRFAKHHGFEVIHSENISGKVAKTWDLALEIVSRPKVWKAALRQGRMLVDFVKGVQAMRAGFSSGTFEYGVLIARKGLP